MTPLEWRSIEQDPSQEFFPQGLLPPAEDRLPGLPFHRLLKRGLAERLATRAARHRRQFDIDRAAAVSAPTASSMVQKFFLVCPATDTHENKTPASDRKIPLHDGSGAAPANAGDVLGDVFSGGEARGLRGVSPVETRTEHRERGMASASAGVRFDDGGVPIDEGDRRGAAATGECVSSAQSTITGPMPRVSPGNVAASEPETKPTETSPNIGWSDWQ